MLSRLTPFKAAAVAAVGTGVLVTGGIATAATGALPGAAQNTAHEMLGHVGVTVPGANEHSVGHADTRGSSADHVPTDRGGAERASGSEAAHSGKGSVVSGMATSVHATGGAKGAAISDYASGGQSRAGEEHPGDASGRPAASGASGDHAQVDTPNSGGADHPESAGGNAGAEHGGGQAPVDTPNGGGTGTADTASNGHSSAGTGTAGDKSAGHSSAGSQNAAGHAH